MYIAHDCPDCKEPIVMKLGHDRHVCRCGYSEDDLEFWRIYDHEQHLREAERDIERSFPMFHLNALGNSLNLAVGWHVLGRYSKRDACIRSIVEEQRELVEKFQVCYCDFDLIEKNISRYRTIGESQDHRDKWPEETERAEANLVTIKPIFDGLVQALKDICK